VYQTEKVLRDQADKVTADDKAPVESALADLKSALNGNDMGAIKAAHDTLMGATQAFSQKLYEAASRDDAAAAGSSASGQSGTGSVNDDEIIDAEIVDEK